MGWWIMGSRIGYLVGVVALVGMLHPSGAYADPGDLDPSFGSGGIVSAPSGDSEALALQADGNVVATGIRGKRFATARYLPDGSLDTSFGELGAVVTRIAPTKCYQVASAIAIEPDGRIVVAGSAVGGVSCRRQRSVLVRYDTDGVLDPTFGGDGIVRTAPAGADSTSGITGIAVQPNGRIVAAGWVQSPNMAQRFVIARYLDDGRLDPSFSRDGITTTDINGPRRSDFASALTLQPNGKILVSGTVRLGLFGGRIALARYNSRGRLDTSFGEAGVVVTSFASLGCGAVGSNAIAVQPDGRIVVAGGAGCGQPYFALARYLGDGSLDPTFGSGGKVVTLFEAGNCTDEAEAVAIQSDGAIVAAGRAGCWTVASALARYDEVGVLDPGFGTDGKLTTSLGTDCYDSATGLVIQPDGKAVTAVATSCPRSFVLARYLSS